MAQYRYLTSEERAQIIDLRMKGLSARLIAHELNRGTNSVDRWLRRCGRSFPAIDRRKATPAQEAYVLEQWQTGRTRSSITLETGLTEGTVRSILKRHNAPHHAAGRPTPVFTDTDRHEVAQAHLIGESVSALALHYAVGIPVIKAILQAQGIEVQLKMAPGAKLDGNGYVRLRLPSDHPYYAMVGKSGYVAEHRITMAEHLGRPLTRSESVHHINGDRQDNSIENLQLRDSAHGIGVVRCCGDCGSKNIVTKEIG